MVRLRVGETLISPRPAQGRLKSPSAFRPEKLRGTVLRISAETLGLLNTQYGALP